jgi:hypothetical protein
MSRKFKIKTLGEEKFKLENLPANFIKRYLRKNGGIKKIFCTKRLFGLKKNQNE